MIDKRLVILSNRKLYSDIKLSLPENHKWISVYTILRFLETLLSFYLYIIDAEIANL